MAKTQSLKLDSDLTWIDSDLNEVQQQAVTKTDGPVLILAGAGSGKTRVLTYRIAYILANGLADPKAILAMTFTNKAASEMRERISKLVPNMLSGMWIGTFHSLFARILRRDGERIGYSNNFSIYDAADQNTLVKRILKDFRLESHEFAPKLVSHRISEAKNSLILPDMYREQAENYIEETVANIYAEYQNRLRNLNAMDFDDLLIKPIELFEKYPLVRDYYQDKFQYVMVDEYQDTNRAQYVMLKLLVNKDNNICVVGDDDQSIYRWRGAEIRNILDFEKDYSKCSKYRLEQNYRSTQNILSAAHSVVKNNRQRHPKELWTKQSAGEPVTILEVGDELEEARTIVNKIGTEFRNANRNFHDFAILYRTNAQSRVLEESLRKDGIPYIIVGGVKFYERKEVKDVLAYLKVLVNPADSISLRRIINYPARGIGETTLTKMEVYARTNRLSFYETLAQVTRVGGIQKRTAEKVYGFYKLLHKYNSLRDELSPFEVASAIVEEIGILQQFKEEDTIESITRGDNVRELLTAIADYSNGAGHDASLEEFLEQVSLTADIDNWDDVTNAVTLMTLHSAKGLEFPVVFIAGIEEGLFPLSRSMQDPLAVEEERRLFYVGTTRAKEKLYLSWAKKRRRYGERAESIKSRFLKELDDSFITIESSALSRFTQRRAQKKQSWREEPMPNYEDQSQEQVEFRPGMRVGHQMFGKGTVLQVEPAYGNIKLVILFDSQGRKRLVLPYAKLEIL